MAGPDRSTAERHLVPAGYAIAVVLLSLVMCAVLDADAVVASIEQQPFGTSRSVGLALARPVRTLSHWTGLNRPRRLLDALLNGRPQHPGLPVAVKLPPGKLARPHPAQAGGPTSTTATPVVGRRVPTTVQPLKVWIAGDSLMGTVSESFAALTNSNHDMAVTDDVRIGTGLARPDVYDWPAAVSQEVADENPDVVVLMFGANDDQDMQSGGQRVVLGTDAWRQEYERRVSQMMAVAATGNREVIWLGVPAVRRPRLNHTKDVINGAVITEAARYPSVTFLNTGAVLDGPSSSYATYLTSATGQPVKVRESDGIHFTLAGANRVTPLILTPIERAWGVTTG
jgi:hypothetical protein